MWYGGIKRFIIRYRPTIRVSNFSAKYLEVLVQPGQTLANTASEHCYGNMTSEAF